MTIPYAIRVSAAYGMADTFWDIYLQPQQLAYAGVENENRRHISVFVDPSTGEVSLNNAFEPGSQPYKDENCLFDEYKDAIVETLVQTVPLDHNYESFQTVAREDSGREERIAQLGNALDVWEHDEVC